MRFAHQSVLVALALTAVLVWGLPAAADPTREPPLSGTTRDYHYDGRERRRPELAWYGRAYVPPQTAKATKPVPLVVFLHGLNAALIKYRWMGGGLEGDVRRIVGALVDQGEIAPLVIAGPSSIVASQVSRGASWNHFDVDDFIDRTKSALEGVVVIDETRIVVAGHSGAGCSSAGGLATVGASRRRLLAILSIDTCMGPDLAKRLATADPETHVVVSYQRLGWTSRPFDAFVRAFAAERAKRPAAARILRELDEQRPERSPHDATVALTFQRWLPKLLPPE